MPLSIQADAMAVDDGSLLENEEGFDGIDGMADAGTDVVQDLASTAHQQCVMHHFFLLFFFVFLFCISSSSFFHHM